jgi:hypothetical protein
MGYFWDMLLLSSPYGFSLIVLDVLVGLVGGLLPLGLALLAFRWAFRRLQQPNPERKQQAQLALSAITLATAGYFFGF